MKKKLSIVLLLLLTAVASIWAVRTHIVLVEKEVFLPSVDGREELKKLYAQYMNTSTGVSISGTNQLLDEEHKDQLKEETSFESTRSGKNIYSRLSYLQTYIGDSITLQLDTVHQTVIVGQNNGELFQGMDQKMLPFEQFMKDTGNFRIDVQVKQEGKERVLLIHNDLTPEIKSSKIFYDPATYTLKRADIEWWKGTHFEKEDENKCWISRIAYNGKENVQRSIEDMIREIVVLKGNQVTLTERYKNYRLQAMPQ